MNLMCNNKIGAGLQRCDAMLDKVTTEQQRQTLLDVTNLSDKLSVEEPNILPCVGAIVCLQCKQRTESTYAHLICKLWLK